VLCYMTDYVNCLTLCASFNGHFSHDPEFKNCCLPSPVVFGTGLFNAHSHPVSLTPATASVLFHFTEMWLNCGVELASKGTGKNCTNVCGICMHACRVVIVRWWCNFGCGLHFLLSV